MSALVEELSVVYAKIMQGTATEEDRLSFDLKVKMSCMDEKLLLMILKEKFKEQAGE